jgi:Right handed beta helix region
MTSNPESTPNILVSLPSFDPTIGGQHWDNGAVVTDGYGNVIANSFISYGSGGGGGGGGGAGGTTGIPGYSIVTYGAVSGQDCTTAIQNTVNAVIANGGGAIITPPDFNAIISSPILIDSATNAPLWFYGCGWSSKWTLANGANCYMIKSTSNSQTGLLIQNMKFDCNSANQTAASGAIYGYKYRRCTIDGNYILNPWQAGIWLDATSGDFGYQNKITRNYIVGGMNTTTGTNAYGEGLRLTWTDENVIAFNHFENNGNPNDGTYGFHIYDQNGLATYVANSFVNGMGVMKFDGLQNRIIGNAFDGNGGNCIQINASANQTIVTNNTFLNVGFRATGGSANSVNGIYVNSTEAIIKDNYFQACGGSYPYTNSFVKIDTGATYSIVEGNTFNVQSTSGTLTGLIIFVSGRPAGCRTRFNDGYDSVNSVQAYVTENYGTATITSGNTSIAVTHGLGITPNIGQIQVTPQASLGSASKFWISSVGATTFTINVDSNPGANVAFSWQVYTGY